MQEDEWFVKWIYLSIIWAYPVVDMIISNLFLTLSLVTKEYHLEHFTLKYLAVIEIAGWDYYYSSQEGQENNSSTGIVHDFC